MKKNTVYLLGMTAILLIAATVCFCLSPAITGTITFMGRPKTSSVTFFDCFDSTDGFGMGWSIVFLLPLGLVAVIGGMCFDYYNKLKKASTANFGASAFLIFAGTLFFLVNKVQGDSLSLNGIKPLDTHLGYGAICSGICAISAGIIQFVLGVVNSLKKVK